GVGAGGTEVIDPLGGVAGSGTMKLGQVPEGSDRTTLIGAVGAGAAAGAAAGAVGAAPTAVAGPPPVAPPPVAPEEPKTFWQKMTTGRGRVVTILVFAILVLGGAGLVIASMFDDGGTPAVTPSATPSVTPSRTPSPTP